MHALFSDLRHSAHALLRMPGFVLAALLTIALGVSATTAVFSVLNAVLIRSLPYADASRLVYMWTPLSNVAGLPREHQPFYVDIAAWSTMSRSFEGITALQRFAARLDDEPKPVGAAKVLGNFFETLQSAPELSRTIEVDDDQTGKEFVAVISDRIWHSKFGGALNVVGRSLRIAGQPYRVIGVMRKEFGYPHGSDFPGQYQFASWTRTDVWIPAAIAPKQRADRDFDDLDAAIGRLRPGVSLPAAQAEISAIEERLEPLHSKSWGKLDVLLVPFIDTAIGPVRPLLRLLMASVCLVLILACSNFASLLIARAADRAHEMDIRAALGAEPWRLIRLVLSEALILSLAGGALGILLGFAALKYLVRINPADIPRFDEITLDMRVLIFGFCAAIATGLMAGIFPALSSAFESMGNQLRQGGRGSTPTSSRARSALIVGQIALSVALLAGAGVLIRSYLFVQREDKGFAESAVTMSVVLNQQDESTYQVRRKILDAIRSVPGVQLAGSIDDLPLSRNEDKAFLDVEGYFSDLKQTASVRETDGDYFRAMQIPLIMGRFLRDRDFTDAQAAVPGVVLVSQSFAKRYFPARSPLGHRLRINQSRWYRIVGVVGDVRHSSLEEAPEPTVYLQQSGSADSVALRSILPTKVLIPSIRRAVSAAQPGAVLADIKTMNGYVDEATGRRRFQMAAITSFAVAALVLTLVGLYSLTSYTVRQRSMEIGIRMALGASRTAVLRIFFLYGLRLTSVGLAIGLCLAFLLARGMTTFLYGVRAEDPTTFVLVPVVILTACVIACATPAWRAASTEPIQTLRQ